MNIDPYVYVWLNVATILVIAGGVVYASLWRYMD
jgi:hypothetical protein